MRFCKNCVMPDTRPDLEFDEEGICYACRAADEKFGRNAKQIDWEARKREFEEMIEFYRDEDETKYDCIVPVSGGKDSTFQVYTAMETFGLKCLCVCFEPSLPTEIGRHNLENLNKMGVDLIHFKRNPIVYEKLIVECFKRVGDMEWPNHQGIWVLPFHFAIAFDIPMIIWGENEAEFSGTYRVSERNLKEFDDEWWDEFGGLNGLRPEDMVSEDLGISLSDMAPYLAPSKQRLASVRGNKGCVGAWLGYYVPWDSRAQVDLIEEKSDWRRSPGRVELTYNDFENLDCLSMNLHDYLKYCKFGFGRATDDACRDLRHGYIERDEAVRLAERYDGVYPKYAVDAFCRHFDMPKSEFDEICDGFTNPAIFEMRNGKFLRDIDGSLVMKPELFGSRRQPDG